MHAHIIEPRALTSDQIALWRELQLRDPTLWSPFFSPEFTLAVGVARADARLAVLVEGGQIRGFFPFHPGRNGVGKPVGGPISDYQGVISAPGMRLDSQALLKASRLDAYDFNHAPASQIALNPGAYHFSLSPHIDLRGGYAAYLANLSQTGKQSVKETNRRIRKLEREVGPLRFEFHDDSANAYGRLVAFKNASYRRLGVPSILDVAWVDRALSEIRSYHNPHFAGILSTLYAGDRLIAAHMGMRSSTTICWWFNTYDWDLRIYAPGLILLLQAVQRAADDGLTIIDFGRGTEHYKLTFANGGTQLCEGSIELPNSFAGRLRRLQKLSLNFFEHVPLGPYQSYPRRALARLITGMRLRET
jgi:CelD/BcsL family acetyltransferase involved in cellulose biosynthesis